MNLIRPINKEIIPDNIIPESTEINKPYKIKKSVKPRLIAEGILVTKAKTAKPTEHREQVSMVQWLTAAPRRWLVAATANGVNMGPQQRNRFAQSGGRRGLPDLLCFTPIYGYVGIAIEMKKTTGGKVSPEQYRWMADLKELGWLTIIAYGYLDGIEQIESAIKVSEDIATKLNPWSEK